MKKNFRQIIYISELNLPNTSAQALQTLKMCSAFANKTETKLIVLNSKKNFILEVGIGMGENLIHLSRKNTQKYIIGVDPFPSPPGYHFNDSYFRFF